MARMGWLSLAALLIGACSAGAEDGADLSQSALLERLRSANPPIVLDVRTPAEYAAGHVPGARNIPHSEVSLRTAEIGTAGDTDVVVYCERGPRARQAQAALEAAGYRSVLHLEGDMSAWRAAKLPCEGCAPE